MRVHGPRPLRRDRGRHRGQRRDAADPRGRSARTCGGGRRRRRTFGHDGRAHRGDPRRARHVGLPGRGASRVRREVRVRLLRAIPRGRRVDAVVRRPPGLPDGPRERARGDQGGSLGRRGGRGPRHDQARALVPRRRARRPGGHERPRRLLQRVRGVRDGEGGRPERLDRRQARDARDPDVHEARGRGPDPDVSRERSGGMARREMGCLQEEGVRAGSVPDVRSPLRARPRAHARRRVVARALFRVRRRESVLRQEGPRRDRDRRRRQPLRGLGHVLRPAPFRARVRPGSVRCPKSPAPRHLVRRPDERRGRARRARHEGFPVDGEGALRVVGNGSHDERGASRARRHGPRPRAEVRGLLSRTRGLVPRLCGLRRRDARHSRIARGARVSCRPDAHRAIQRPRLGRGPLCRAPEAHRNDRGGARRRQHGRRRAGAGISRGPPRDRESRGRAAAVRRGHHGLPRRQGRRPGALRRARGPHVPRKDPRGRAARRRLRRPGGSHGQSRAGRSGLPGRDSLGKPARDGGREGDARLPHACSLREAREVRERARARNERGREEGRRGRQGRDQPGGIDPHAVLHEGTGQELRRREEVGPRRRSGSGFTRSSAAASSSLRLSSRRCSSRPRTRRATSRPP